ncbi:MAG: hypothetical protein ACRDY7_16545 [Acidimicrobiia bacterium]
MYAAEARSYSNEEVGCATHLLPDCLCDVQPIEAGVPIRAVPFAQRLLALGVDRFAFLSWADEVMAFQDSQGEIQLAVEA